jgi:hypothetical protein
MDVVASGRNPSSIPVSTLRVASVSFWLVSWAVVAYW